VKGVTEGDIEDDVRKFLKKAGNGSTFRVNTSICTKL